jgi:ATP/ADP translocase
MNDSFLACLTCAKNFADHTNAIGWAIFALLALILPMLGGVVFFMIRLARRSDAALDPELRDEPLPVPSVR